MIWLKFGMKANFRVLGTKWVLKSSSCFCLAKNRLSRPSTPIISRQHGVSKVFLYLWLQSCRKDFLKSLELDKKIYPFSSHLLEKIWEMTDFDYRLSRRSAVVLLVSLISSMLPRSRSCPLFGKMFVYGYIDSINKKMGKI